MAVDLRPEKLRAVPRTPRRPLGVNVAPMTSTGSAELIFVVEEAPEGGYLARALGVPIFTEADTMSDLRERVRDAVRCHFEEGTGPRVIRLHFVREEVLPA